MRAPRSSPTWCASSSAGTTPPPIARCRTRRPRPSCSSTSPIGLAERLDAVRERHRRRDPPRARELQPQSEQGDRLEDIRRRHGIGSALMDVLTKATVRELVLSENIRIDGRDTTTIRPISVEVGVLPRTHGSGLFTRGQTQALSIATLGPSSDVQRMDTISPGDGEALPAPLQHARRTRSARRSSCAVPAGARSATARWPSGPSCRCCRARTEFPYVIRVVSEVVSSNGSTSMASTCGSHPGAHGRRRADQGAGGRRGDGPDHRSGDRPLRRPDRHHRQGRRLRRHGLQGGRHRRGRHRAADGHQGRRHHHRDHA